MLSALLFLTNAANAGTWQARANDPLYTCTGTTAGGATILQGPNTSVGPNTALGQGPIGSSITVSGTASFQWTWVSTTTPKEPPPSEVIFIKTITPYKATQYGDGNGTVTPAATTTYGAIDSSSGTVTVSVPVSATLTFAQNMDASAVTAAASDGISPVIITVGGAANTNGNYSILIGQQASAALSTMPYGCTAANLMWSVSGNTVQANSWNVSDDLSTSTFTGLQNPYTLTQATPQSTGPSWFWDDVTSTPTITCVATISPPTGPAFPLNVTQKVSLVVPPYTNNEPTGVVQVNTYYWKIPGVPGLHAGGGQTVDQNKNTKASLVEQADGITFNDTVLTPSTPFGGGGIWYHVQLISVGRYETPVATGSTAIQAKGNSVSMALDYGSDAKGDKIVYDQILNADGTDVDPDNDSPDIGLTDSFGEYAAKKESFQTYIMYQPPGGRSIPVPLASFSWSWNADVKIPLAPIPKSWANYNDAPTGGTITGPTTVVRQLQYPKWTAVRNLNWATP